jgi:hypothetical protein
MVTKKLLNQIYALERKKEYAEIINLCEEAIKKSSHTGLVINQDLLYFQCKAYCELKMWEDVVEICKKRRTLIKERRNLFNRYAVGEVSKEELKHFKFLNEFESELSNLAWNSQIRRLDNEKRDIAGTIKRAKIAMKKQGL